jgi:hypothetical protein
MTYNFIIGIFRIYSIILREMKAILKLGSANSLMRMGTNIFMRESS